MNQDFHNYYSTLSTVELLQIQAEKEKYQPEAIEALEAVLQTRTVTDSDREEVQDMADAQYQKTERAKERQEAFVKAFVDMTKPGEEKSMQQQLKFFCGGLAIVYLFGLYKQIRGLYLFSHEAYSSASMVYIAMSLYEIIVPVIMITLLYKQKKAGWIMAAFIYTFSLIITIDAFLLELKMSSVYSHLHVIRYTSLATIVIISAILYYLNTGKFMGLFSITRRNQRISLALGAATALIYMIGIALFL